MALGALSAPHGDSITKVNNARKTYADLLEQGRRIVLLPTLSTGVEESLTYRDWLALCFDVIKRCDYLVLAPGWEKSPGCVREYRYARLLGKPVLDHAMRMAMPAGVRLSERYDGFIGLTIGGRFVNVSAWSIDGHVPVTHARMLLAVSRLIAAAGVDEAWLALGGDLDD